MPGSWFQKTSATVRGPSCLAGGVPDLPLGGNMVSMGAICCLDRYSCIGVVTAIAFCQNRRHSCIDVGITVRLFVDMLFFAPLFMHRCWRYASSICVLHPLIHDASMMLALRFVDMFFAPIFMVSCIDVGVTLFRYVFVLSICSLRRYSCIYVGVEFRFVDFFLRRYSCIDGGITLRQMFFAPTMVAR